MQDVNKNEQSRHDMLELSRQLCLEDYNRVLSNYSKIYDRINMAMALCSALFIFILNSIDLEIVKNSFLTFVNFQGIESLKGKGALIIYSFASVFSIVSIFIALILLLYLSLSMKVKSFDSRGIEDNNYFGYSFEKTIKWALNHCISAIDDIREKTKEKQKEYNEAIKFVIGSLVFYLISIGAYIFL